MCTRGGFEVPAASLLHRDTCHAVFPVTLALPLAPASADGHPRGARVLCMLTCLQPTLQCRRHFQARKMQSLRNKRRTKKRSVPGSERRRAALLTWRSSVQPQKPETHSWTGRQHPPPPPERLARRARRRRFRQATQVLHLAHTADSNGPFSSV